MAGLLLLHSVSTSYRESHLKDFSLKVFFDPPRSETAGKKVQVFIYPSLQIMSRSDSQQYCCTSFSQRKDGGNERSLFRHLTYVQQQSSYVVFCGGSERSSADGTILETWGLLSRWNTQYKTEWRYHTENSH